MKEVISAQQARKMVSAVGWNLIARGYEWRSKDNKWAIVKAGYLYFRRRVR